MMRTGDRWLMTNVADEDDGDDDNYDDNGDDDVINVLMAMMVRRACCAAVILICIVTHVAAMKSCWPSKSIKNRYLQEAREKKYFLILA